jgi:hypothetical protein
MAKAFQKRSDGFVKFGKVLAALPAVLRSQLCGEERDGLYLISRRRRANHYVQDVFLTTFLSKAVRGMVHTLESDGDEVVVQFCDGIAERCSLPFVVNPALNRIRG